MREVSIDVAMHLRPNATIEAATVGSTENHLLRIGSRFDGTRLVLWCDSPEQAEEIARACVDLADRMRGRREPDALVRVHRAIDALDDAAPIAGLAAEEDARARAIRPWDHDPTLPQHISGGA